MHVWNPVLRNMEPKIRCCYGFPAPMVCIANARAANYEISSNFKTQILFSTHFNSIYGERINVRHSSLSAQNLPIVRLAKLQKCGPIFFLRDIANFSQDSATATFKKTRFLKKDSVFLSIFFHNRNRRQVCAERFIERHFSLELVFHVFQSKILSFLDKNETFFIPGKPPPTKNNFPLIRRILRKLECVRHLGVNWASWVLWFSSRFVVAI